MREPYALRLSPGERELLDAAARYYRMPLSEFIRGSALEKAELCAALEAVEQGFNRVASGLDDAD